MSTLGVPRPPPTAPDTWVETIHWDLQYVANIFIIEPTSIPAELAVRFAFWWRWLSKYWQLVFSWREGRLHINCRHSRALWWALLGVGGVGAITGLGRGQSSVNLRHFFFFWPSLREKFTRPVSARLSSNWMLIPNRNPLMFMYLLASRFAGQGNC